jgi:enoyl-CoA hydratase/carnithine racemase
MADVIELTRDGDLAFVVLNRPDKLNALDKAMWRRLSAVMDEIAADDGVRCVVIRGNGAAFGAGADLAEFATERHTPAAAEAYAGIMGDALLAAALGALRRVLKDAVSLPSPPFRAGDDASAGTPR